MLRSAGLVDVADQPFGSLSTGTARRLELLRGVAGKPALLLLDEPSGGLDEAEAARLRSWLRAQADSGVGVLVVTHDMDLVAQACDVVHVLHVGRVIASGTADRVTNDEQVRAIYLGSGSAGGAAAQRATSIGVGHERVLELEDVHAGYGPVNVLQGVSLSVEAGRVHTLLGPNGSGKSTMVNVACGLLRPDRGSMSLFGHEVGGLSAHTLALLGVCAVPQRPSVFSDLTVAEHLRLTPRGRLAPQGVEERAFEVFPRLAERASQYAGTLSGGEQEMLAIARALALDPIVLILDEPSYGLSPRLVDEVLGGLRRVAAQGTGVLLVEQLATDVLDISDVVTVLRNGRVAHTGPPDDVWGKLAGVYLGVGT
jgi:ABC-type branched-subunit amino acid transport system ATPase component